VKINVLRIAAIVSTISAVALVLAACSSSSVGPHPGTGSGSLPAGAITVPVKITRAGGPGDVSQLCAKIAPVDVQKLFKGPTPNLSASPGECAWGGTQVRVNIYLEDTAHSYYTGGPIDVSSATPLAGVGDQAVWTQAAAGAVPLVAAHEASTTCTVTTGLAANQTTMVVTGTAPSIAASPAEALKYAQAEGQVCTDVFAAASATG